MYVSPGHLIDLQRAVEFVLGCRTRYRLPEPTRWAHRVAGGEILAVDTGRYSAANHPRGDRDLEAHISQIGSVGAP